jgi:diguanylate cyclase (GGDEF)-like protein
MNAENGVPEAARRQVRRVVMLSRAAGAVLIASLLLGAALLHQSDPTSGPAVYQFATIVVGGVAFIVLSTLARLSHAGIIERSLTAVRDLSEQLKQVAERDPLTGLYNLRAFHERLSSDLESAQTRGEPLSLVVADLDNFKLLNDSFGHAFGDRVLQETASVFEQGGGARAASARLGGDEFAIVLPGASRDDAVAITRAIERALAEVRIDERQPATLGSFGIGTYPEDGESVQSLFAAADGRMYGEKHQRKAEALASLAGASRKLFVSVGAAMRPDSPTIRILDEIVTAARDEFALAAARIYIRGTYVHPALVAATAVDPTLREACQTDGVLPAGTMASLLPAEAWIIETPIPSPSGQPGQLLLAGLPNASFRPDTPVTLALADLLQAVVANGRAHDDAARAGAERDIHIELAHALAGAGTLYERLARVVDMVQQFIGARAVSIEGLRAGQAQEKAVRNIVSGLSVDEVRMWEQSRGDSAGMLLFLGAVTPCVVRDAQEDPRIAVQDRSVLRANGIRAVAVTSIRFDGEFLGILSASSTRDAAEAEAWLDVLTSITEHLAPVMKVAILRDELEASYGQLERASRDALARLADVAEARDPHTRGHVRRIAAYTRALALELGIAPGEAAAMASAAMVHDLGKLRLPDEVLMNPGRLDAHDWRRVMRHPIDGERLIGDSPMFAFERAIARWHHERWDGSGYPDRLAGEAIPLPARIVAVADAFDALTTRRPYRAERDPAEAVAEIAAMSGSIYSPGVARALVALWEDGRLQALYEASAVEQMSELRPAHDEPLAA